MVSRAASGAAAGNRAGTFGQMLAGFLLLGIAGCAAPPPPPPPPTVVELKMSTTADVNPSASGQGAPVAVRIYQLASPAGFEKAEFYRLFSADAATLGADIVKKDEYLLAPGASRSVTLTPNSTVHSIGVFAGIRDFQKATWRGTADVPPNKTTIVTVTANASGVTVAAAPAPAPAKPAP